MSRLLQTCRALARPTQCLVVHGSGVCIIIVIIVQRMIIIKKIAITVTSMITIVTTI